MNRYEQCDMLVRSQKKKYENNRKKNKYKVIEKKMVNRHEHTAMRIQQLTSSVLLPCDMLVRSPKENIKIGKGVSA